MNIIDMMNLKTGVSVGAGILVILMTLIQIAPIKFNPWDKILTWIGNHMNADIVKRVDVIEAKLDEHIKESSDEMIRKVSIFFICPGTGFFIDSRVFPASFSVYGHPAEQKPFRLRMSVFF